MITQDTRSIVDAAVAAGMVRRIPMGVSGIDHATGRHWHTIDEAIAAFRRAKAELELALARPRKPAAKPRRSRSHPWTTADDERLRIMFLDGHTLDAMAEVFHVSHSMVWRRVTKLGLSDSTRRQRKAVSTR